MSLLLQLLLGAKVDGSGSSLHADGRTRRDKDSDLPMRLGERDIYWRSSTGVEDMMVAGGHPFYQTCSFVELEGEGDLRSEGK